MLYFIGQISLITMCRFEGRNCFCCYKIIIIIAPLNIVCEDQWEDFECLYKACQAAIIDGGLFTDTGVDERGENKRQSENDCEMKTVR